MKHKKDVDLFINMGDLLDDGIVLYDLKQKQIVYINAAGTEMTGIHTGDDLAQITRLWPQVMMQDRAYLIAQYHETVNQASGRTAEFGILRDKQKKKYLQVTACVIQQKQCMILFLRDITFLKEHEDYLVEFGAKKNTLLDTLTHNLSGSLNLAHHLTAQAEKSAGNAGELQTLLSLITENNKASIKIIEDFLAYEHEKSPRIHIKPVRIDLVEKVGFVHQQLLYSYPERTFRFISSLPEIHITTDEVKLLQIINNFVSNAIKFSHTESPVEISIQAASDRVRISVSDYGIGIPESLKPLIFLRQPGTGRTGLHGEASHGKGLSICRHLVDLMNGSIGFESSENAGSTFYITLPYSAGTDPIG